MGDHERGHAARAQDARDRVLELEAGLDVERAERLVEKEHLGIIRERARKRDALRHPAGERTRRGVLEAGEADELEQLAHAALEMRRAPARARSERDVVRDRKPREEREVLEHERAPRIGTADLFAARERVPAVERLEPREDAQERRLAAARRPEQTHHLAGADLEVEAPEDGNPSRRPRIALGGLRERKAARLRHRFLLLR